MALKLDVYNPQVMECAKNVSLYSIFFRPAAFGGRVLQYAGWAELRGEVLNICILDVYFSEKGLLDPEVEKRLGMLEYKDSHSLYRVFADRMEFVHGAMPAKV